jgi:two-component system CheB/CheR fusion protein
MPNEQRPEDGGPESESEEERRSSLEGESETGQMPSANTPVVGIGASAGGLEAFKQLIKHLPLDTGFAFVLIQHLDPAHYSALSEILGRETLLPVSEAKDGEIVEPNCVYVIAPNTELTISRDRVLRVTPRTAAPGWHLPIDRFLRSLAEECGSRSIGVILSGTGTDGAAGLQAIKEAGGVTFAQEPSSAEFASMPRAAAESTGVDFVLAPAAIAAELGRMAKHPFSEFVAPGKERAPQAEDEFRAVFKVLRDSTGIDFSLYRPKTMYRRILRRLALRNSKNMAEYVHHLETDSVEIRALQQDLLITVTSFFRDPESFAVLKQHVFPKLVKDRPDGKPIRIWVPGCATGEEPYSIAILLQEYLNEAGLNLPVTVFASDINETAIEKARSGRYLANIAGDMSPDLLSQYFTKDEAGFHINKSIREMCVFSRHNLIEDPPFAKLDLISCRNVLIYLGAVQREILSRFHYALKPESFLFLGSSEMATFGELFSAVDAEHRIFARRETPQERPPSFLGVIKREKPAAAPSPQFQEALGVRSEVDYVLHSRFGPLCVVVDVDLEVLEIRGPASPFLSLPSGPVDLRLMSYIPDIGLYLEVERLVRAAQASEVPVFGRGVQYDCDGQSGALDIEVVPLYAGKTATYLVLFERTDGTGRDSETQRRSANGPVAGSDSKDEQIARLKRAVDSARHRILTIVEEQRTTGQEARNVTNEALSANEELQSLNEELETAKEELQSTNEELITLNEELENRNTSLTEARDYVLAIVETVRQPLLVLDSELRLKTSNAAFCSKFGAAPQELEGALLSSIFAGALAGADLQHALLSSLPGGGGFRDLEFECEFPRIGHRVLLLGACRLDVFNLILLSVEDVTDSREAERSKQRRVEEQLRQAQKMEAVGRLAGGIAHDFNNLLTAIIGYSDLILHSQESSAANTAHIQQIKKAGERAAALTEQLLAFSRQKILQPKILDLATVVADFERMLGRLMDERIRVVIASQPDLWRVRADPGEIGRALMNLCLNARDAMPGGGILTVATTNVTLGEPDAHAPDLPAGRYVLLSVTDNGVGIGPEMLTTVFEPFFTTKDIGKGTGLGLATVHGIVEQSGGAIWCESVLGQGTTFKMLLPAVVGELEKEGPSRDSLDTAPRGTELILLVEDEDGVRQLARSVLEMSGYAVLEAQDGSVALKLCGTHPGRIHLLLSDLGMPGMRGGELIQRAMIARPDMKVLITSGHTQDVLLREGIKQGMPFLQKPFSPSQLAHKVRDVLDSED